MVGEIKFKGNGKVQYLECISQGVGNHSNAFLKLERIKSYRRSRKLILDAKERQV